MAGLYCTENLAPTEIQSPDRPALSESLYRLRYAGPTREILLQRKIRLVWREGCRFMQWKWHNAERFCYLQTSFRTEEAGLPVVSLCGWVTSFRRFEGTYRLNLQSYDFVQAVHFFERLGTGKSHSATNQKTRFINNQAGETSNYCFLIVINIFLLINLPHLLLCSADVKLIFYN